MYTNKIIEIQFSVLKMNKIQNFIFRKNIACVIIY